ncbi:hypothetical protein [Nocardia goodfellowii]|uniref:Uncharacterized protein n=1 Tax=Nocardia goodfellowii TaxID=882446 RepID=A0ABS4QM22_9NOCA|nr:hypothetical protein [Nocardia goodfellowii]MBP2192084.1 hypothetical protein [Nocardia goodfellowii]
MNGIHTQAPERTCGPASTIGTHAMLVFGTGADCYLSNLPKFTAPHNFQVMLAVELDERGTRALEADQRTGFAGPHTFVPDEFALTELDPRRAQPRKELRGSLFRGHVHRGGQVLVGEVVADIRQVVHFDEFAPIARRGHERLTHLCFGRPDRLYVAHRICRRPSFDQIVAARLVPGSVTDLLGDPATTDDAHELGFETAQPIILGQRQFTGQRLRAGEIAVAAFGSSAEQPGFLAELAVERQIYLEVADLG